MMSRTLFAGRLVVAALVLASSPAPKAQSPAGDLVAQVMAAERGFARSMADRDLTAFAAFVADDAVFFSGPEPRRGKPQVVEWWSRFFAGQAPFSWEPDHVEVLPSGGLALSTGPVRDPNGQVVSRFNSIWRRDPDGQWRIVFDKGEATSTP